jgi:hypothetical protein
MRRAPCSSPNRSPSRTGSTRDNARGAKPACSTGWEDTQRDQCVLVRRGRASRVSRCRTSGATRNASDHGMGRSAARSNSSAAAAVSAAMSAGLSIAATTGEPAVDEDMVVTNHDSPVNCARRKRLLPSWTDGRGQETAYVGLASSCSTRAVNSGCHPKRPPSASS